MKLAQRQSSAAKRSGAAFLMLVVMVLLVVVGATQSLVRSELTTRRSDTDRVRLRSMTAALDAVLRQDRELSAPIRLPVDDATDQYIEVSPGPTESHLRARWFQGEKMVTQMQRTKEPSKSESNP